MEKWTVGVVGLGLMGGSFAKAVRGFRDCAIVGLDKDANVVEKALSEGAIDAGFLENQAGEMLPKCDLVMIALYPMAAVGFLKAHGGKVRSGAVVTDMVGVKGCICEAAREFLRDDAQFVGGHPMAGRATSGYSASTDALFRGCNYILVEDAKTDADALSLVKEMAEHLGALSILCTDAITHDQNIAYTSQMAHVLAAAIMLHEALPQSHGFTGGSFFDLTRVANLNDSMWSELFLLNSEALSGTLCALENQIKSLRECIEKKDGQAVALSLQEATRRKKAYDQKNGF